MRGGRERWASRQLFVFICYPLFLLHLSIEVEQCSALSLRCMVCEWQVWDAERARFPPLFTVEKELG